LVEGVIEKGANGLVVSKPKIGKSVCMADLAIALAAGQLWMPGVGTAGFYIPRQVRVGFCAREDTPGLTKWRLKHIAAARQVDLQDIKDYLWLNSKEETPRLMIDDPEDMRQLLAGIEKRKIEFLILDVFRRLHSADENDPNEMQKIIDAACSIQDKTGCQITLVHHKRKDNPHDVSTSLTDSARGSSVIAGYAEFVIGMTVVNPEAAKHEWVREMEVELKAAIAPENWYCRYVDQSKPQIGISVERVFWEPPKKGKRKADNVVEDKTQPPLAGMDNDGPIPF
jgi:RecA-family ATPase